MNLFSSFVQSLVHLLLMYQHYVLNLTSPPNCTGSR